MSAPTDPLSTKYSGCSSKSFSTLNSPLPLLSIVGQANPDVVGPQDLIIEAALFQSGRPVVVVPYIQRTGLTLDRVLLCWDGGRQAARAIADALPFLHRAKAIEVVIVATEPLKSDELPGANIARHLARHDLNVDLQADCHRGNRRGKHYPVLHSGCLGGFHRHGWVWPFAIARVHPRRRDARAALIDDDPDAPVTLSMAPRHWLATFWEGDAHAFEVARLRWDVGHGHKDAMLTTAVLRIAAYRSVPIPSWRHYARWALM